MEFEELFDWDSSDSADSGEYNSDLGVEFTKSNNNWSRPSVKWLNFNEDIHLLVLDADFKSHTTRFHEEVKWYFRLHGVTQYGNSCCCNVYDFLPYFYVIHSDSTFLNDKDVTNLRRRLSLGVKEMLASSKSNSVVKNFSTTDPIVSVIEVRDKTIDTHSFTGYVNKVCMASEHGRIGHQLLKITCLCPRVVQAARKVLDSQLFCCQLHQRLEKPCKFFIIDQKYQMIQWLRDLKLSGSPWVRILDGRYLQRAAFHKSSHAQIEVDVSIDMLQPRQYELTIPTLRILSFDIEVLTTPPIFEFPLLASKPILQIGNVISNLGGSKGTDVVIFKAGGEPLRVIFTLKSCSDIPGAYVYSYENEVDLLNAWSQFILSSDPDILTGYNIHQFDLPYLFSRAEKIGANGLQFLGRVKNVKATQHHLPQKVGTASDYSKKRIAINGRIVIDMMLLVMKHNTTADLKSSVNVEGGFSLEAVANRYLQMSKLNIKHTEVWELQAKGPETRKTLAMYCLHDALLPYLLLLRLKVPDQDLNLHNIIQHYISNSRRINVPIKYLIPILGSPWNTSLQNSSTFTSPLELTNVITKYKPYLASFQEDFRDLRRNVLVLCEEIRSTESSVALLSNEINGVEAENVQLERRVQELIIALNKTRKPEHSVVDQEFKRSKIIPQFNSTNNYSEFSSAETSTCDKSKNLTLHQINGVKFLLNTVMSNKTVGSGAILGCAVGSGKSAIVLSFWKEVAAKDFGMLVLCTKNGLENWKSEIKKWLTLEEQGRFFDLNSKTNSNKLHKIAQKWSHSGGILLSTYKAFLLMWHKAKSDAISSMSTTNEILFNPGPAIVVLDEGHVIRNSCTNIFEAVNAITTKRKIIVSGTVMQNSLEDVFALTSVVRPGCLNSKKIFNHRWKNTFDLGLKSPFLWKYCSKRATNLRQVISNIFYNSTIGTLLPVQKDWIFHLRPSPVQNELLKCLLKSIYSGNGFQEKHSHSVFEIESLISRILSHPDILLWNCDKSGKTSKPTWAAEVLKNYSPGKLNNGVKLEVLFEIFKDAANISCKVIVYSKYLETLDVIEFFLTHHQDKRHKFIRVDGSTSSTKRQSIYNQINRKGGPSILLISTGSGSDAVNLHGASITVLVDVNWNPGVDTQCLGRTKRYAHDNNSVVYRLVVEGTFDALKLQHQSFKQNIVGLVMGSNGTSRDEGRNNSFDFLEFEPNTECNLHLFNQMPLPDQILRITQELTTSFANQIATPYYESS